MQNFRKNFAKKEENRTAGLIQMFLVAMVRK